MRFSLEWGTTRNERQRENETGIGCGDGLRRNGCIGIRIQRSHAFYGSMSALEGREGRGMDDGLRGGAQAGRRRGEMRALVHYGVVVVPALRGVRGESAARPRGAVAQLHPGKGLLSGYARFPVSRPRQRRPAVEECAPGVWRRLGLPVLVVRQRLSRRKRPYAGGRVERDHGPLPLAEVACTRFRHARFHKNMGRVGGL